MCRRGAALRDNLPEGAWTRLERGFFVGITLLKEANTANLCARAEEAGLMLSDGRDFFPNPADGDRFVRLPFSSVTEEEIAEGVSGPASIL